MDDKIFHEIKLEGQGIQEILKLDNFIIKGLLEYNLKSPKGNNGLLELDLKIMVRLPNFDAQI
jgi:hypothetical protein